jgi:hypothetical protein
MCSKIRCDGWKMKYFGFACQVQPLSHASLAQTICGPCSSYLSLSLLRLASSLETAAEELRRADELRRHGTGRTGSPWWGKVSAMRHAVRLGMVFIDVMGADYGGAVGPDPRAVGEDDDDTPAVDSSGGGGGLRRHYTCVRRVD